MMNISYGSPKKIKINEGVIINSIEKYIESSNFPRELVESKIDLHIQKRKAEKEKIVKMIQESENIIQNTIKSITIVEKKCRGIVNRLYFQLSN